MKTNIYLFIIISWAIIFSSCTKNENPVLSDTDLYEIEKYQVYSTIIDSEFNQGLIFILDTTASGIWIQNENPSYLPDTIQSIFPSLKFETIEEYKSLNKDRTFVEDKFNVSINYNMISPNEKIDSSNHLIPRIDFTNVAFDKIYKQSLVYFAVMQRGGFGQFLFLEKEGEYWIIKKIKYVWASR